MMNVVILAAGKGTRLGEITRTIPKSLVLVCGKPILEYTLSSLPSSVNEIFIVVGHLGDQIQNKFGDKFGNLKITYLEQKEFLGTAKAILLTEPFINEEKFLVLNGDDIYQKTELEEMTENNPSSSIEAGWAFGLTKTIPPRPTYLTIELDANGNISGARYPSEREMKEGTLMATGAYVLGLEIFKCEPVAIANGEYGLPQTIIKLAEKIPVKGFLMKNWIQINTPEDIIKAEEIIKASQS